MTRCALSVGIGLLLAALSGCNGAAKTSTANEQHAAIMELTEIFQSITDEQSAEDALDDLESAFRRYKEANDAVLSSETPYELTPQDSESIQAEVQRSADLLVKFTQEMQRAYSVAPNHVDQINDAARRAGIEFNE